MNRLFIKASNGDDVMVLSIEIGDDYISTLKKKIEHARRIEDEGDAKLIHIELWDEGLAFKQDEALDKWIEDLPKGDGNHLRGARVMSKGEEESFDLVHIKLDYVTVRVDGAGQIYWTALPNRSFPSIAQYHTSVVDIDWLSTRKSPMCVEIDKLYKELFESAIETVKNMSEDEVANLDYPWVDIYAAVDEISRNYGGPEEGGWWYDSGNMLSFACFRVRFVRGVPYISESERKFLREVATEWLKKYDFETNHQSSMAPRENDHRWRVTMEPPVSWSDWKPYS